MINWRTTTLSDLEPLQKCAPSNNFFANNYGAVNSVLYEKKFRSQIAVENGWLFEKFYDGQEVCFAFPHSLTGENENIKSALLLLADDAKNAALSENNKLVFENILSEEKVRENLLQCSVFSNDPAEKKMQLLLQKLSNLRKN